VDLYTAKVPNVLYAIVPHYSKACKCRVIMMPLAAVGAAYFGCPYTAHVAPRQQASHCKLQPVSTELCRCHVLCMECRMLLIPQTRCDENTQCLHALLYCASTMTEISRRQKS